MKQNFNSQELLKYLKKGELIRSGLEKDDVALEIDKLEEKILDESFEFNIKTNDEYYFIEDISQKYWLES